LLAALPLSVALYSYVGAQIAGSVLASAIAYGLTDLSPAPRPGDRKLSVTCCCLLWWIVRSYNLYFAAGSNEFKALIAEIMFTFALVSVVLNVGFLVRTLNQSSLIERFGGWMDAWIVDWLFRWRPPNHKKITHSLVLPLVSL
jgi:glycerol uptake facilitator-like aquaporin